MARIFISYKRVDKDKVLNIVNRIETALNEKCWIDFDGIESDAQFKNIIIRAINECEIMLFMYSKTHINIDYVRDWTMRELNFAMKKNKRIVFVNIDRSPLADAFEFDFGTQQQVDGTSEQSIARLLKDLDIWLKKTKSSLSQSPQPLEKKQPIEENKIKPISKYTKKELLEKSFSDDANQCLDAYLELAKRFERRNNLERANFYKKKAELVQLQQRLPAQLKFQGQTNPIYMFLSSDKSFYIGNLTAKDNDYSWFKKPVVQASGSIIAACIAVATGLITWPVAAFVLSKTLSYSDYEKQSLCDELNESSGAVFTIPKEQELKDVSEDMRQSCIVLRVSDNIDFLIKIINASPTVL